MIFFYVAAALFLFFLVRFIIVPWRQKKWYAQHFRKQGYRVLEVPLNPFGIPTVKYFDFSNKRQDCLEMLKKEFPDYDVVIFSIFGILLIELICVELQQELLSHEKQPFYQKSRLDTDPFKRVGGQGITVQEYSDWKPRRKVLNEVFHFNFIKSLAPRIAQICDRNLDQISEEFKGKQIDYDVEDYAISVAGKVIFECFFSYRLENEKIQNQEVLPFFRALTNGIFARFFEPHVRFLGLKFQEMGLTAKDRDINSRLKIYKAWSQDIARRKVQEIKRKHERE